MHLVGVFGKQRFGERLAGHDLVVARVSLETADRGHKHCRIRGDAGVAALDIEETLSAHVGAKTGLGEQEVPGVNANLIGNN